MTNTLAQPLNGASEPPKRLGRPPGSTIPADQRKSATIRERVTPTQAEVYRRLGGAQWLRYQLDWAQGEFERRARL